MKNRDEICTLAGIPFELYDLIEPAGPRILIKEVDVKKTTSGGLIIPDTIASDMQMANNIGLVIKLGSSCYNKESHGEPWCEPGDYVSYSTYSGLHVPVVFEGTEYNFLAIFDDKISLKVKDINIIKR